jgi:hypothetical protein
MVNPSFQFDFFIACEVCNLFCCMISMLVDMLSIGWWCHVFALCHEYMLKSMLWMLGWGSLVLARLCS